MYHITLSLKSCFINLEVIVILRIQIPYEGIAGILLLINVKTISFVIYSGDHLLLLYQHPSMKSLFSVVFLKMDIYHCCMKWDQSDCEFRGNY